MANAMAAFASRAPAAKVFRASPANLRLIRSFALARSRLTRRRAAPTCWDTRYSASTILRRRKEVDVTQTPAHCAACPTLLPTEPASWSEPRPEAQNPLPSSLTDNQCRPSISDCANAARLGARKEASPVRCHKITPLSRSGRLLLRRHAIHFSGQLAPPPSHCFP